MQPDAKQLVRRSFLFAATFYLVSLIASAVFSRTVDWQRYQNPQERLLWDPHTDVAEVVLLGDSAFLSAYVNSPADSLSNVLHRMTGRRVFNGALNGADAADFLNAAGLLARNSTRNAVVVLDIVPTRFLPRKHPELKAGNYPGQFTRLMGDDALARTAAWVRRPLIILDPDIMLNCLFRQTAWYGIEPRRDRVWFRDGDLAQKRFRTFEKEQLDSDNLGSLDWIQQLDTRLKISGNRLIIFITPINETLIQTYASRAEAHKYGSRIARSRQTLLAYLDLHGIAYIDATGQFDSESFVDLIHPNARGDRRIAGLIAAFLATDRQQLAGVASQTRTNASAAVRAEAK